MCPAPGTRSWCLLRWSQGVLVGQPGESGRPARTICRYLCCSSLGTHGLVSSPCCGITSASVILLPPVAHEPHPGLDCPPLWSQPLVGLPGSRSARRPRHHPHFHGPADHGCHPQPQGVQAEGERGAEDGQGLPGVPAVDGEHPAVPWDKLGSRGLGGALSRTDTRPAGWWGQPPDLPSSGTAPCPL